MKAVIIAGGKGTRMGALSKTTPKALLAVGGKTLLERQFALLREHGYKDVLLLTNHLGEEIEKFCGDGSRFGLSVRCIKEGEPLGTAGAVLGAEKYLTSDFLVLYGDELLNVDLKRFLAFHNRQKAAHRGLAGTLAVHPNDHPLDSNLVEVAADNTIRAFLPKPHSHGLVFRNLVSTPLYILTPEIFKFIPKTGAADFGRDIFPNVLRTRGASLVAYATPEYLKDIGTPARLREAERDVASGRFQCGSLRTKRPAIFLDRDGIINEEVGDLRRVADFKLISRSAAAIRKINQSGYYAVVVSNQPVVAKGFCSYDTILEVHKKMETLLAREGAKLDAIYFCPHHPDKGFAGENKKYKIACSCRKPKTGMITRAARDLHIDLKKSVLIGDSTRDAKTAENAGIKFVGVKTGYALKDAIFKTRKSYPIAKDLWSALKLIAD